MSISMTLIIETGAVVRATWADGHTTKVESDGAGGLVQIVRNSSGQIIAAPIAGLVLKIEKPLERGHQH